MDRSKISVREMIEITQNRGAVPTSPSNMIQNYVVPRTDLITDRPHTVKIVPDKIKAFIDKQVKDKEWVPAPSRYSTFLDWTNPPELKKKGHFSKQARVTFTEGILKDKRLREWPGPASYKTPFGDFDSTLKKKERKVRVRSARSSLRLSTGRVRVPRQEPTMFPLSQLSPIQEYA